MRGSLRLALAIPALLALAVAGCDMEPPEDNPPPPTVGDVVVNEFLASNSSYGTDENGDFPDWIELYNRGTAPVNLAGYTITDNLNEPTKFTIPGGQAAATTIAPGGFLLIFCDANVDRGPLHTGFALSAGGEDIGFYEPNGDAVFELTFTAQTTDVSYGRTVDAGETWALLDPPTPGASNQGGSSNPNPVIGTPSLQPAAPGAGAAVTVSASVTDDETVTGVVLNYALDGGAFTPVAMSASGASWSGSIPGQAAGTVVAYYLRATDNDGHVTTLPASAPATTLSYTVSGGGGVPVLFINEFLASNATGMTDPNGDFDDWIEIYNPGATPVNLGGMYITDDLATPDKFQIATTDAAATTVPAHGYLILWADGEPGEGAAHITPKLSAGGEAIGLYTATLQEVDTYTFGAQAADVSTARVPDGSENWTTLSPPTPGATNGQAP